MRWRAVLISALCLVSGLFVGIGAIAANPAPEHEDAFVGRIAEERSSAGLGSVAVARDLVDVARGHAQEMKRQQRLHHNPDLQSDVQGWQSVGENVGVGSSVEDVHRAFMESANHRDVILGAGFTQVGVGVITDGPDMWVVQVFRKPSEPPQQRPAAEPSSQSSSGGGVRAATAGSTSSAAPPAAPPSGTSPSTPVATTPPAPPSSGTVPTSAPVASAPPASVPAMSAGTSPDTSTPSVPSDVAGETGRPAGAGEEASDPTTSHGRQVTVPVAIAATMLLLVVIGLGIHVGSASARGLAGATPARRMSPLDLWELALAG